MRRLPNKSYMRSKAIRGYREKNDFKIPIGNQKCGYMIVEVIPIPGINEHKCRNRNEIEIS